jgi:6-phosphogluconolactonase (cycloisomerase 2 family)
LLGTTPSAGETPVSVTIHGSLIYVLNAGGEGNISGFRMSRHGKIKQIYNSILPLSGAGTGPAQIEFSPDGRYLVVSEKGTNSILTYKVRKHGHVSGPVINTSSAPTPFGFAFDKRGRIIVSEANGGAPNPSFVSSYKIRRDGTTDVITAALPTLQIAACWIAVTRNGKYAYTTNAGSGTIGGLSISHHGSLSLLNDDGITGVTGDGSTPLDLAFSKGDKYLYSLNGGTHNISAFSVGRHGSLTHVGDFGVLPETANGLAAQ